MAQLVAHLHGMQGVRGSNPLSSTIHNKGWGELNSNKIVKMLKYVFSILMILSSLLIFFKVSLPLFDVNITEVDKRKVIGMKTSAPLEFDGDLKFWWLIRPENNLQFTNYSDEKIKGIIVIELGDNPCQLEEALKVIYEETTQKLLLNPGLLTNIYIPLEMLPRSSQIVSIIFTNQKKCRVENGDQRDFGAKLLNWRFD